MGIEVQRGMMSGMWYRAALSGEQVAAGHVTAVRDQFAEAVRAAGEPEGACLFVSGQETGAEVTVFFSPLSVSMVPHVIALYGAQPSPPPDRNGTALMVGQPSDWNLLPRSIH